MPFLVAEILNFQGSAHHVGVGSLSKFIIASFSCLFLTDALKISEDCRNMRRGADEKITPAKLLKTAASLELETAVF